MAEQQVGTELTADHMVDIDALLGQKSLIPVIVVAPHACFRRANRTDAAASASAAKPRIVSTFIWTCI